MKVGYDGTREGRLPKDVLGQKLLELIQQEEDIIYLDADLMHCISTAEWAEKYPGRAINCGIAEANMVGVACGLAAAGFRPIIHTFAPFASRRVFDQIFLSAGYAKNDITVIGTDPGVTAAFNGGTHMPFEDMALYRAIPTATVIDIADTKELLAVLGQVTRLSGVKYIRTPRKSGYQIYEETQGLTIGKGQVLREGTDAVIFACGIMVGEAMAAAKLLEKEDLYVTVVDLFTVKPLDEDCVLRYARNCGAVVTAENHNKIGGLTSAVAELLAEKYPVPVEHVAVEDAYGEVGPQEYLQKRFGLTKEHLIQKVKQVIDRKINT